MTGSQLLDLLRWLAGIAAGSGVIIWLGKTLITQMLSRNLERFKGELRHESEVELMRLRASLKKERVEYSERTRFLHAERGPAIRRIHDAYNEASQALASASTMALSHAERSAGARILQIADSSKPFQKLVDAFVAARGFLPGELADATNTAIAALLPVHFSIQYVMMALSPAISGFPEARREEAIANLKRLADELPRTTDAFMKAVREVVDPPA